LIRKNIQAILILLLLSPFTAEVLTGATPIMGFVNPINLCILVCLYGLGSIIIRELRLRLRIQYTEMLLLGFAYGIIEEGIAVKSFFDPYWKDLGIFGVYGRWLGVNWVWSLYLTIFHGIWSILAPIIVVEAIYFEVAYKQWIGNKGLIFSTIVFFIDIIVINLLLTKYQPSSLHYLTCFVIILALIFIAKNSKLYVPNVINSSITPQRYGLYWMLWGILFFVAFYLVSSLVPSPYIPIIIGLVLGYVSLILTKCFDSLSWNVIHRYWFYLGIVVVLLIIDTIQALIQSNIERGITVITSIVILTIIYEKIKRKQA